MYLNLLRYRKAVPLSVKRYIISLRWNFFRLPYAIKYYMALYLDLSLETQIKLLPAPLRQPVYWTHRENIKYHGTLFSPPAGRFCLKDNWDKRKIQPIPSIYEVAHPSQRKWDVHETIRSIFLFGKDYTTTPQYKNMIKAIKENEAPQRCFTITDVDSYFNTMKEAYNSIKKNGYLSQKELGNPNDWEIQLHITEEGKLCLVEGNHRIRLSEMVGIKYVPFFVKGVHPSFIKKLCEKMSLPPHKAIKKWMNDSYYATRPLQSV